MSNKLIALEGIDFAGKSTVSRRLAAEFPELEYIHEPGGTPFADMISDFLMQNGKDIQKKTKTLLFEAARNELVATRIKPTLEEKSIILDRFVGSTIAYQGFGDGQTIEDLVLLNDYVLGDLTIDATILYSITPDTMRQRRASRQEKIDELDSYKDAYYDRINQNYHRAIEKYTKSKHVIEIDANQDPDDVYLDTLTALRIMEVI